MQLTTELEELRQYQKDDKGIDLNGLNESEIHENSRVHILEDADQENLYIERMPR